MNRTQIQLPDQLYQRAKQWAEVHECSLAELTRRGLESYLDRYSETVSRQDTWQIPVVNLGRPKIAPEDLREYLAGVESRAVEV
jgi:hypothetical protein